MYTTRHSKSDALEGVCAARDVSPSWSYCLGLHGCAMHTSGSEALLKLRWRLLAFGPSVVQPEDLPDVSLTRRALRLRANRRKS
jgi:hypothetical protein